MTTYQSDILKRSSWLAAWVLSLLFAPGLSALPGSALTCVEAGQLAQQAMKGDVSSVENLERAADAGDAEAQVAMGALSYYGLHIEGVFVPGYEKAMQWYRRAADQGSALGQYRLGFLYATGEEGRSGPDHATAVKWFRMAAMQGNADAQYTLGTYYENGWGVPKDLGESVQWYRQAASGGSVLAQLTLGRMYRSGSGLPKSDVEAVFWYGKAAKEGNQLAQRGLAGFYAAGHGVDRDDVQALKWAILSEVQDGPYGGAHDPAKGLLIHELENRMTLKQVEDARNLAEQWRCPGGCKVDRFDLCEKLAENPPKE